MAARRSIRWGLTLWVVLPLLALLAVGLWVSFNGAWQQASLVTDRLLTGSARVIAEDLYFADGRVSAEIPPAALEIFASESRDRVVYRVIGPGNTLIGGYADLAPPPDVGQGLSTPVAYDVVFRAEQMRAVAFPQQVATSAGVVTVIVVVAETVKARSQLLASLLLGQVTQQVALVALAAAFIWVGIGRELRPLLRLASTVQGRRPDDLAAIDVDAVQVELSPLIVALNGFMSRLERVVTRQREFLDGAAHQLRTPLAVLKTQVSVALRAETAADKDETLRAIDEDLSGVSRLANQLLLLGRAEHDPHSVVLRVLDISGVAAQVVGGMAPRAFDAGLDIALDVASGVRVKADDMLFRELLSNLVENSILYAGRGASASVSVCEKQGRVIVRVADNGPGVRSSDRERIMHRFQRGADATGVGSGLGLSIVAELVNLFGGTLEVSEPADGGFAVELTFASATI